MKTFTLSLLALALLMGASPLIAGTPCENSALQMYKACVAEANEDRFEAYGICTHIEDTDERIACREEADDALTEMRTEECPEIREARMDACELLGEWRHVDPLTDPANEFVDPDDIGDAVDPNPYFPLIVGRTDVLRAGEDGEEIVVISVTDDTVEFHGVACRVVVEVGFEIDDGMDEGDDELRGSSQRLLAREGLEYVATEVTRDFYAQTTDGDIVYCGEDTYEIGDQEIADGDDGSFYSGNEDRAHAGWLLRAAPTVGVAERQEMSLGEAEDLVEYLALAAIPEEDNEAFPCAPGGCLMTHDSNPLEPGETEFKYYAPGVGFVLALGLEDGEPDGDMEALVCTGDSVDVLGDPECEIENVDELWEELCELAFDPFCELEDAEED